LFFSLLLPASAGMQEILEAVKSSEFKFARSVSEVPFMPMGWMQDRFYPNSRFEDDNGVLPAADVVENTFSLGTVVPVYVANRDMLLCGGDLGWDRVDVKSGPYRDQSILRLTPVTGWLHQFGDADLVGIFAAPIFSKELLNGGDWGVNGYGGVVAMHWFSDEFQLLYGGVYEYSYGKSAAYPYLGLLYSITPRCTLGLVFPWPNLTYAASDRWLLQLGISPGGSSWVKRGADYEATESLSSWNFIAGASYRFQKNLWLYAGAGVAGFRGLEIESGDNRSRLDSKPSPVFTLAIQFRPE
jgi:opacity protein-like surface antigen